MQVKLEIGHKAACRSEPTPEGFTHDWTVFVRGSEGNDISHFVEKVIFHLHESFHKPKRAIKDPPYKLDESGYGSFELKIEVCFKTKDEPRRVHFTYDLFLPLSGYPPVTSVRTEALTFTHPTEDFMRKLVKGGGVPISAVNGVSNGVSNGHPPTQQENKEAAQKIASSIYENEKTKKNKIPKSSSKPSSAVVGMKRSPPLHEQTSTDGVPKKKKKSSEGSSSSKTKHLPSENVTMPVSQPLTTEVKDLKVKFKPIPPKESVEKDEKKDAAVDGHKTKTSHSSKNKESKSHKSEHESKKLDSSEHKMKVKKKGEKSEKKRDKKSKSKKDKIEKVTIRRSSGDSWASAGNSGLMSNVVAKNKALGKLLSEMSSDEDEGDLTTPFKHQPSPILSKEHSCLKEQTISKEQSSHMEQISNKNNANSLKGEEISRHTGRESGSHVENNSEEQLNQTIESNESMKSCSSTIENGSVANDEKMGDNTFSKKELYQLYERIKNCKDPDCLQKVVDVIETTGLYTLEEKTFEFDLYRLETTTLQQLRKCLGIR